MPGVLFGALLYPLWKRLIAGTCPPCFRVSRAYPLAIAIAVPLATVLQRWKSPPRLQLAGLYRASARRRLRHSLRKSVLGEVELAIDEQGLVRVNADGELRVPWTDVIAVVESPSLLTILLPKRWVLIAPARAFAAPDAEAAFRDEVVRRAGKGRFLVPDAP